MSRTRRLAPNLRYFDSWPLTPLGACVTWQLLQGLIMSAAPVIAAQSFFHQCATALSPSPFTLCLQYQISCEALRILSEARDARGRKLEVIKVPLPPVLHLTETEAAGVQVRGGAARACAWTVGCCGWKAAARRDYTHKLMWEGS